MRRLYPILSLSSKQKKQKISENKKKKLIVKVKKMKNETFNLVAYLPAGSTE